MRPSRTRPLPRAGPGRRTDPRRALRAAVPRSAPRRTSTSATLHALGAPGRAVRRRRRLRGRAPTTARSPAAVWPFFGQFVAHDITADRSPLGRRCAPGGDPQLPRAEGRPRGRLRRRPDRRAVPVRAQRPREAPPRPRRARRAAQPGGHRAPRRSAQRRAPLHERDAGRVHRPAQPARRPAARRRHTRARRVRAGTARGHVALPAHHPARVPPGADRGGAVRRAAGGRRPPVVRGRRAVHPVRVRRRRVPLRALADPRPLPGEPRLRALRRCSPT